MRVDRVERLRHLSAEVPVGANVRRARRVVVKRVAEQSRGHDAQHVVVVLWQPGVRGQIARAELNVPVIAQLHRNVCPPRCALVLTDLEYSLLAVVVARHVVGNHIAAARDTGAIGSAMSIDERTIDDERIEDQ